MRRRRPFFNIMTWQPEPIVGIVTKRTPTNPAALRREVEILRRIIDERNRTIGELRQRLELYQGDSRHADTGEESFTL